VDSLYLIGYNRSDNRVWCHHPKRSVGRSFRSDMILAVASACALQQHALLQAVWNHCFAVSGGHIPGFAGPLHQPAWQSLPARLNAKISSAISSEGRTCPILPCNFPPLLLYRPLVRNRQFIRTLGSRKPVFCRINNQFWSSRFFLSVGRIARSLSSPSGVEICYRVGRSHEGGVDAARPK